MAEVQDIAVQFAPSGVPLPDNVTDELVVITRLMSLSPQELFFKWESYVMKMGVENVTLDFKTVKDFKKDLQDTLERESRAKGHLVASTKKTAATPRTASNGDVFGMIDGMSAASRAGRTASAAKRKAGGFATPAAKSSKNDLNSSPADSKVTTTANATAFRFEDRQNPGQIMESINNHITAPSARDQAPTASRIKLKANTELPKFAYKGMAMKLSEASEILDDRIDTFADLVQAHHQLEDSAFGNPAAISTSEIVAVGRIACDVPGSRLNTASIVLETSRRMGAGMRVPLQFNGVEFDVFPGKIVALRGTNVSGESFNVSQVLDLPQLAVPASTPSELDIHNDRLTEANGEALPLSLLIGNGPYTTDSDLSFAPLQTLLDKALEQQTDVIVLTGPFLDVEHPLVVSGDFDDYLPTDAKIEPDRATLNDVFRLLVAKPIQELTQALPTITIIMVPSTRDIIDRHVSWPQDRFGKAALGLPKQVQVVPNPITLSINEMIFGICSQDVLSEMRRENVFQPAKGSAPNQDMLARLAGSIVDQRHYFPVFPPQAPENLAKPTAVSGEAASEADQRLTVGASLDLGYLKLGEWLNVRPDILILPSVLSPFAKVSVHMWIRLLGSIFD